jgi:hypothetical protein
MSVEGPERFTGGCLCGSIPTGRRRLALVQYRLQPVTVGVPNERRIVPRIVVFANAGRSFIDTAFADGRCMKAINRLATWGHKCDMEASTRWLRIGTARDDGEGRLSFVSLRTVPCGSRISPKLDESERSQTRIVKVHCALEALDTN